MSLKQEIETWVAALAAYDNNEFDSSLKCFEQIADTSKILFNLGVICATLGQHERAVGYYQRAVQLDQYLAVAYFQQGVSNFLMGDFEEALANFNDTLLYLRGNNNIDYEQLGLRFKLYACEVLFNRGLCYIYLQQKDAGMQDLMYSSREKAVQDHDVIDEAIREQAEGYTVFSIPVGVVYRPNEAKVRNLQTKDYLGKARLVAAQNNERSDPRRAAALAAMGIDDRPSNKLSYAALNLVKPDLRSRTRQQSEPPMQRNIFPPTPPPEPEHHDPSENYMKRRSTESTRSAGSNVQQSRPAAKPLRLELGAAAFERKSDPERSQPEKPRLAPKRSESERPRVRREYSTSLLRRTEDRKRPESMRFQDVPEVRIQENSLEAAVSNAVQANAISHQRTRSSVNSRQQPLTISEEEEEDEESSDPSDAPLAFEIIAPKSTHHRRHSKRAPELRKVRIKVHAEDMRYVMTTPHVKYEDLAEQIRVKCGLQGNYKLKVKDEDDDMITLGDQDDLDMAMSTCKAAARKEKVDMGKMEIWVHQLHV